MAIRGTLFAWILTMAMAPAVLADELVVIVHVDRSERLTVPELEQIYLKRRQFWSNGDPIVPVNRDAGSEARESFVRTVFGARARHLGVYWNRQYFQGVLPPLTLASDEAVKRYVAREPRAVGYVRRGAADSSVKVGLGLRP